MVQDECPSSDVHCQHLLLGTGETIFILDELPQFGQWMRTFFVELELPRTREFLVRVLGA